MTDRELLELEELEEEILQAEMEKEENKRRKKLRKSYDNWVKKGLKW